jgi:hypothetical protein
MLIPRLPQISEVQSASVEPKALCVLVPSGPLQTFLIRATHYEEEPLFIFGRASAPEKSERW